MSRKEPETLSVSYEEDHKFNCPDHNKDLPGIVLDISVHQRLASCSVTGLSFLDLFFGHSR